jgi:hypothetical protein
MRALAEFNPQWCGLLRPSSGEALELDCPKCGPSHRLRVNFSNPVDGQPPAAWLNPTWKREGATFDTLTIEPSIQYPCFHGWIEDGQVIDLAESKVFISLGGKRIGLSPRQARQVVIR